MGFYSYACIDNEVREGFKDEPVGTLGRWIDRDIRTLRGAKNRINKWRAKSGTWVKIWSFPGTDFPDDDNKFRLVDTYQVK